MGRGPYTSQPVLTRRLRVSLGPLGSHCENKDITASGEMPSWPPTEQAMEAHSAPSLPNPEPTASQPALHSKASRSEAQEGTGHGLAVREMRAWFSLPAADLPITRAGSFSAQVSIHTMKMLISALPASWSLEAKRVLGGEQACVPVSRDEDTDVQKACP